MYEVCTSTLNYDLFILLMLRCVWIHLNAFSCVKIIFIALSSEYAYLRSFLFIALEIYCITKTRIVLSSVCLTFSTTIYCLTVVVDSVEIWQSVQVVCMSESSTRGYKRSTLTITWEITKEKGTQIYHSINVYIYLLRMKKTVKRGW